MSSIYKLTIKQNSGLLTELQSDTVFGHFCWRMKEISGEEKLVKFLQYFKESNPIFTISNSLFEREDRIYFPNPLSPQKSELNPKSKKEKIVSFLNYKKSKDKKYISIDELNKFLNGEHNYIDESINDKNEIPKYKEDLRTSVEISRVTFSNRKSQLFSYAPFYIDEILIDPKKQIYSDTKTILLIKVINEKMFVEFNCKEILEEVFNIGFGKKKSSGYGEFKYISFEKFEGFNEPEVSNGFISLSNYIPSMTDELTNYFYDFIVKYGKLGEELSLSINPFKKPIVLFTPGSIFFPKEQKDFYGRCTSQNEISESFPVAIQNGFCFSLRAKLN